jgi:hypothetical protein
MIVLATDVAPTIWLAVGAAAALLALDRLLLWMESRGWIYWRRTKKQTGAHLGDAFLEIQAMVQPGMRHVVEERRAEGHEEDESGDPPEAGDPLEVDPPDRLSSST